MKSLNLNFLIIPIAIVALAISAQLMIKLPDSISIAPITGQSLAILLIAELMDWKKATLTVLFYLILGGLGLPLFADYASGWDTLFGVASGYFAGFLIAASFISYWSDKSNKEILATSGRLFTATLLILISGWIGLLRFLSPTDAFFKGVLPFLPGAIVKIFLAFILISVVRRFIGIMKADTKSQRDND